MRKLLPILLSLLLGAPLMAQTVVTRSVGQFALATAQVAAITNGTTTIGSTTVLSRTAEMSEMQFIVNITGTGAATGNLKLYVEDSPDAGTTWNDLCAGKTFAFGASANSYTLDVFGKSEGPGTLRSVAGAAPAAGADISDTVPTGARWQLLSFATSLTTSGTVANRAPLWTFDDGANVVYRVSGNINQTASTTWNYDGMQGFGTPLIAQVLALAVALPANNRLGSGYRIKTVTGAIQAADQWAATQYSVLEWRGLDGAVTQTETYPDGVCRSGPWGDRLRLREVITSIAGSPTGPTYSVNAVIR
jgi:hypothetical protein